MLAALLLLLTPSNVDFDVVYSKPMPGVELMMDIYHPVQKQDKPVPAVVVVHGGAWVMGHRRDMAELCQAIAERGMLAATVSYRLAPRHKWPAQLDDVQTAVRYLRANASRLNIDPKQIGAAGASAGGHLSLFLGSIETRDEKPTEYAGVSSRVAAVFNIFGPTDLTNTTDYPQRFDMMYAALLGKPRAEAEAEVRSGSPLFSITKDSAPVFILHGTLDQLVPVAQGRALEKKLREVGVPVEAVYMEGVGHEIPRTPEVRAHLDRALEWLKATLSR
jgi:acetyl esterase/lipase